MKVFNSALNNFSSKQRKVVMKEGRGQPHPLTAQCNPIILRRHFEARKLRFGYSRVWRSGFKVLDVKQIGTANTPGSSGLEAALNPSQWLLLGSLIPKVHNSVHFKESFKG